MYVCRWKGGSVLERLLAKIAMQMVKLLMLPCVLHCLIFYPTCGYPKCSE